MFRNTVKICPCHTCMLALNEYYHEKKNSKSICIVSSQNQREQVFYRHHTMLIVIIELTELRVPGILLAGRMTTEMSLSLAFKLKHPPPPNREMNSTNDI